ncbi:DUF416 family protein [Pedobacter sp. ASV28]|uniref:DUF416 family protein n=1 Tax=Pedobacter sp. ASV28 TaxID=2795123 RepID=UPI0018EC590B|nr:DUF416 family protein [Pedobacter sp. ASV28]
MAITEIGKLKELDFNKQLAFAYLTCERLYPNYNYFSKNYDFGDPIVLRTAIDYISGNFFNQKIDKAKNDFLIEKIDTCIPEPADYETILASSALDACTVITETLGFLNDKKKSRLEDISTMATDSVDMYIQEIEDLDFNRDKDFQKKIDSHPLMKKEISIQKGIVDFLIASMSFDLDDIRVLLNLQENNNKGSLNL